LPISPADLLPLDTERNEVDVEVDSATLAELIAPVRRCWEFLGKDRPHYSVLTHEAYKPNNLPDNETAFWASGESEARVLLRILKRHGLASADNLICIDFGCGVGRVTAPLSNRFASVHGYDISQPHIDIARTRTTKAVFHLVRDLPVTLVPTDGFYSRIVFQHNPPPMIALLIRCALTCLKPNGIAVFQVPTYEMEYFFDSRKYLKSINSRNPGMEMHCLPQEYIFQLAAKSGCRLLEVREDRSTGHRGRTISNTFIVQRSPK
jgi:SAM-dependent methyltransferase